MKNDKSEINFTKNLEIFRCLNPHLIKKETLEKVKNDIEKIYNIYKEIEDKDLENLRKNEKEYYSTIENPKEIDYFLIAKMIYFNKKYFEFIPRKIQILSIILFLTKEKDKGLIQQIDTGEGKSCIISFLAVYFALKNNKTIDILTSSPILAKRDAIKFKSFYKSFNLTVDYTSDHNDLNSKINRLFNENSFKCYEANIVYGDALSFEGDILRTYFMGIMGRGKKRKFDCIIIDEIDNIALDNLKNTTELLDCFHGYKFLDYVYLFIYKTLKNITDGKKETVNEKKNEIIQQLTDICDKEFSNIDDLKKKNVYIPNHLGEYIHKRLSDWCESAYIAKFVYRADENYIKRLDKVYGIKVINPIDFYNTGIIQENSVWSGLHQMLQISEKQMLTEENLTSCFLSNLSFFNKYIKNDSSNTNIIIENNIYGLTGTIGSEYNKKTLKSLYKLDCMIIPPYKESKLIIEQPNIILIKGNKNDNNNNSKNNSNKQINYQQGYIETWLKNIENKICEIVNKKRAVLVIFQYIREAKKMYDELKKKSGKFSEKLILYSRSDLNQDEFLKESIQPGHIILSTNLAGRGTDIRISPELNSNGGLHVILTYEPFNQRIERQAFGRAGRKGENGSAGKIIISCKTQEEIKEEINKREKEESEFLINIYKEKIKLFERIFDDFSKFISEIYEKTHDELLILDLKERWGIFLIINSMNNIERDYRKNKEAITSDTFRKIENSYNIFKEELKNYYYGDKKKEDTFKSCSKKEYNFQNGLYLNKSDDIKKIKKGIEIYPELCLGGYMFIIIKNIEGLPTKYVWQNLNDAENYQKNLSTIKSTFDTLIKNINLLIKQFEYYQTIIGNLGYNHDNLEICLQNKQKLILMTEIKNLMEANKEEIKKYESNIFGNVFIHKITIKNFIKKRKLNINKLVIEYFREYGLCLFELSDKLKLNDDNFCPIW